MITTNPVPTLKQIFSFNFDSEFCFAKRLKKKSSSSIFWTARTLQSIDFICRWFEAEHHRSPVFFVPSYICYEMPLILRQLGAKVVYYDIHDNFEIDYASLQSVSKEHHPDFLVAVHFFGLISDLQPAKKWCQSKSAILIEDAAHVIFPNDVSAVGGDICLYSPYKHFAIPNGAAIVVTADFINKYPKFEQTLQSIKSSKILPWSWILKKSIQSVFKIRRRNPLQSHELDPDKENTRLPEVGICQLSLNILSQLKDQDLQNILERRTQNILNWHHCLKTLNIENEYFNEAKKCLQYYYIVKNKKNISGYFSVLNQMQTYPCTWPTLPNEIVSSGNHAVANNLRQSHLFLPIHQGIKDQDFVSLLMQNERQRNDKYRLVPFVGSAGQWEQNLGRLQKQNILQSDFFSKARARSSGEDLRQFQIEKNGDFYGLLVARVKKIGPIKIVFINRGPLLIQDDIVSYYQTLKATVKYFSIFKLNLVLMCPELENLKLFSLFFRRKFLVKLPLITHHSANINLQLSLEMLRANLDSKWRNLLKKAEGFVDKDSSLTVWMSTQPDDYQKLILLYEQFMQKKDFQGLPMNLLKAYENCCENEYKPMCFFLQQAGEIVSAVLIARYGSDAVYLVGINNDIGRKLCGNYLLLWRAIETLKVQGVLNFDLGGFDDLRTPQITHFKRQMNGVEYKTIGTYFVW